MYIKPTTYNRPTNPQKIRNIYYANMLLKQINRLSTTQPTQNKIYSIYIILIHLYPIPKTGHQLLRAFYGNKNACCFCLWPKPLFFMGFWGLIVPIQPTTSSQKFPPFKGSVLRCEAPCRPGAQPQKRRPWLARPPRPSAGKTSDDGFPGMALIHLGPMGSMMIHMYLAQVQYSTPT